MSGTLSPAMMFMEAGIYVQPAINDRINGWMNIKMYLTNKPGRPAKVKIFYNCAGLIETIPLQKYHKGADLNTRGKDDYVDAWRYLLSHIPYGSALMHDGTVEDVKQKGLGYDRERDAFLLGGRRSDLEDLVEFDGLQVSRYAIF